VSEDYLWDGSGPADPEVERLERLLSPLRSAPPAPLVTPRQARRALARRALLPALAVAAALLLVVVIARRPQPAARPSAQRDAAAAGLAAAAEEWSVTPLVGRPLVGEAVVGVRARLRVGDTLATDGVSRARIASEAVGQVVVDPGSRLRVVAAGRGHHRLALEHGVLRAFITAPPGRFVVETPSATATDLGCVYTLRVRPNGDGVLAVDAGWVGFEFNGRESFVPAGASCPTSAARGPGVPRFDDADARFVRAIDVLDGATSGREREAAIGTVVRDARPRDAMTLWHLLPRVRDAERPAVLGALKARVPLPDGIDEGAVLRLDRQALDRWWDGLGLGDVAAWRRWVRPLPLGRAPDGHER
jgi:hypothetical protein